MKKVIAFILAVFCVLSLSACAPKTPTEGDYTSVPSSGNIQNCGYVASFEQGYVYVGSDGSLCKKDLETGTVEMIAEGHLFSELNLHNGEIYYLNGNPGAIWKVDLDGTNKKLLKNVRAQHLLVYGNHIYYRLSEDNDWGKLYRINLNGKNATILANDVLNFCFSDNRIYYAEQSQEQNRICSMAMDGTDVRVLRQAHSFSLLSVGEMLIYSDYYRGDKLFAYDLNTDTETCICEDACWNVNAIDDRIYYRNQSDNGNLYSIRMDGSERRKIADGNIVGVITTEHGVFYRKVNELGRFEHIEAE